MRILLIALLVLLVLAVIIGGWLLYARMGDIAEEDATCPLTGLERDDREIGRPLAVFIDNAPPARPQVGLDKAAIVYEVLAEGGIPRFLAIYHCREAEEIGPIRSARPYGVSLARQFEAALVHAGGSPQALEIIREEDLPDLDEFKHPEPYYRRDDRTAPFNLYSSTEALAREAERVGLDDAPRLNGFSFKDDDPETDPISSFTIPFPTVEVAYEYNESENAYRRLMNQEPHIDEVSGDQLTAKNVIVVFTEHRTIDDVGRLDIETVGSGQATLFLDGGVLEGRWFRTGEEEMMSFVDDRGVEIEINRGQTWIEIVPLDTELPINRQ